MSLKDQSLVGFAYGSASGAKTDAGMITFARDTRQIFVGDGSTAVAFAGNVKNATFEDKVLKIWLNDNDTPISLDFSDVASAEGTASLLGGLRKDLTALNTSYTQYVTATDEAIENITKADTGAIAVAVKAEADLRAEADTSILNKIGTVTPGKTVVDMITEAKAEAVSAHSKVAAEENDFVTVDASQDASGATTYTIKVADVQSAAAYTEKMESIDASFVTVEAAIETLNGTGENSVDGKIAAAKAALDASISAEATARKNAIEALDFENSVSDTSGFVTVGLTQVDGKVTNISVATEDVASAIELARVAGRIDTFLDSEEIAGTVDTLHEIKEWIDGEGGIATELTAALAKEADDRAKADASIRADFATADASNLKAAKDYADTLDASIRADFEAADASMDASIRADFAAADASIREDFTKADASIRADFEAADASNLQAAKDYADEVAAAAKNAVSAEGDAYVSASASNGKVTVAATDETKASLALADSALQKADIVTGSANGTISVEGTDVAVKGLGSAAYTDTTAYDAAGSAAQAKTDAIAHADALTGSTIKTGSTVDGLQDKTIASVLESFKVAIADASAAGVQSVAVNTDSAAYAEVSDSTGAVTFTIKTGAVKDATAENNALATTHDVKTYVDNAISAAALTWTVFE